MCHKDTKKKRPLISGLFFFVFLRSSSLRTLSCIQNGVDDWFVAGAAAQIAGDGLLHVMARGVRVFAKQFRRCDNRAGGAKAALKRTMVKERLLQRRWRFLHQPFQGRDILPVGFDGKNQTTADAVAIQQHGTRAAIASVAAAFRTL